MVAGAQSGWHHGVAGGGAASPAARVLGGRGGLPPERPSGDEAGARSGAEQGDDADEERGEPGGGADAAWRLAADAAALQLLALEAYAQPRSPDGETCVQQRYLRSGRWDVQLHTKINSAVIVLLQTVLSSASVEG